MPLRTFLPGLVVGSALFLSLHFFLGYLGGSIFSVVGHMLSPATIALLILGLIVVAFWLWVVAYRRKKVPRGEIESAPLELLQEGICPACLALYTANQSRSPLTGKE